jgi:hypothetical protein
MLVHSFPANTKSQSKKLINILLLVKIILFKYEI